MKTTPYFILLGSMLTITSCKEMKKKEEAAAPAKKPASLIIGNPLDIGLENISIFPVGTNYKPVVYEGSSEVEKIAVGTLGLCANATTFYDRSAEREYINGNENEFDIRNILFYDMKSGQTYPLVSDTIHVLSFAIHEEFPKPYIFYRVVKKDVNKDSVYNSKDAIILFISDIFGKNLVQVTPDNEQFLDYFYYPDTKKILIKSAIDQNNDKEFSADDETNFRDMSILEPKMAREIFAKSLKDSLRMK